MILEGFTTGVYASNCYIVGAPGGTSAVVIDAGESSAELLEGRLDALGLRLEAILLTHGHIDHVWEAAALADVAGVPAYLHPADRYMLEDPGAAFGARGMPWTIDIPKDLRELTDGDILKFAGLRLAVAHTPGHTPGHCMFLTNGVLFSGDLIFAGGVGRTDFPGGSTEDLLASIDRAVLPLVDTTVILSGHGPETTVGEERAGNPYIRRGASPRSRGL